MQNPERQQAEDPESRASLSHIQVQEKIRAQRVPGVRTVLVVISSRGMVFDPEALRQKILLAYPEAAVFFQTTMGKPIGAGVPSKVDLLIDFTGPRQRQAIFRAKRLRRMARVAVGRNAGLFRKRIYDRVYDESAKAKALPAELLERERFVQRELLGMAGVAFIQAGDTPPDQGKSIALELPPMQRL